MFLLVVAMEIDLATITMTTVLTTSTKWPESLWLSANHIVIYTNLETSPPFV